MTHHVQKNDLTGHIAHSTRTLPKKFFRDFSNMKRDLCISLICKVSMDMVSLSFYLYRVVTPGVREINDLPIFLGHFLHLKIMLFLVKISAYIKSSNDITVTAKHVTLPILVSSDCNKLYLPLLRVYTTPTIVRNHIFRSSLSETFF